MQPNPYQPPPQPPRRDIWLWWREASRFYKIFVLSCVAIMVILGSASLVISSQLHPATSAQIAVATATSLPNRPSPIATGKPAVAATKPATPALLGSDISAFIARYGPPNDHSDTANGQYYFQRYPNSKRDYLIVLTDNIDGSEYTNRVFGLSASANTDGWTMAQASTQCAMFLPRDAVHQNDVQLANLSAIDKVYYSPSIGVLFPTSNFVDAENNPIKAGTFDVQYLYTDASETHVESCGFLLGSGQTK
jgi:hypothetical protein